MSDAPSLGWSAQLTAFFHSPFEDFSTLTQTFPETLPYASVVASEDLPSVPSLSSRSRKSWANIYLIFENLVGPAPATSPRTLFDSRSKAWSPRITPLGALITTFDYFLPASKQFLVAMEFAGIVMETVQFTVFKLVLALSFSLVTVLFDASLVVSRALFEAFVVIPTLFHADDKFVGARPLAGV